MSVGMIAAKYASALLKYVDETGGGEKVLRQVQKLDYVFSQSEELNHIISVPDTVDKELKIKACEVAVGEPMADELSRFIHLVNNHGRIEYLRLILKSFQDRYLKSRNVHVVELTTATPSEEIGQRISEMVHRRTGGDVILHTKVDPDIMGGFIFRRDDLMLDASVRTQLDVIRRQLIERNRRIL